MIFTNQLATISSYSVTYVSYAYVFSKCEDRRLDLYLANEPS